MAYMKAADGAEMKRRPEAIEAGVNQETADAGITKTQVLDAPRKLDEDKVLFKDAAEVETQNCKTQTDLMKNGVGSEVVNFKAAVEKELLNCKKTVGQMQVDSKTEIANMKEVIDQAVAELRPDDGHGEPLGGPDEED